MGGLLEFFIFTEPRIKPYNYFLLDLRDGWGQAVLNTQSDQLNHEIVSFKILEGLERYGLLQFLILRERLILLGMLLDYNQGKLEFS